MLKHDTKAQIENIIDGVSLEGSEDHCTAIRNILCKSFGTSTTVKTNFESNSIIKEEQAKHIEDYCKSHDIWQHSFPDKLKYLARGGEAKIYLHPDNKHVVKINDAIYYSTWLEYLNSILLHNLFFPNTKYSLEGFKKENEILYAILTQQYIISDDTADLEDIKSFLEFNGFENERRQDYRHKEFGLILEDMHDENVLVYSDVLFFIDTVFYTVKL